jgi:hypothetical protein
MKVLMAFVTVFVFTLKMIAQEDQEIPGERFDVIALSPSIMNVEQIGISELEVIFGAMDRVIEKKGKLSENSISPFIFYLRYSFIKKTRINADPLQQINVLMDFYVVDIISRKQISSASMEINTQESDEIPALIAALFIVSEEDEELQKALMKGREDLYEMHVVQCFEFMNAVQLKVHEGEHLQAIAAILNLSEFQGECKGMSDDLLVEAMNGMNTEEATINMRMLKNNIENKADVSDVKRYAGLLAKTVEGKEPLMVFIENYGVEDEYLAILKEASQIVPIEIDPTQVDNEQILILAKEMMLFEGPEKISNLMMLQEKEMWLNELKP